MCYRRAHDVSISAEIGGSQTHHVAQIDVARRQDVSADMRVLAVARQSISGGDTFAGATCTSLRLHRTLQTLGVFLIPYPAAGVCVEHRFESPHVYFRGKI